MLAAATFPIVLRAQTVADTEKKEEPLPRDTYIRVATGLGSSQYRDFATSPLVYKGGIAMIGVAWLRKNEKSEIEVGLQGAGGGYETSVGDNSTASNAGIFSIYYSQLHRVPRFSNEQWNTKVGGLADLNGDFRINLNLGNNAFGFELFPTIFASGQTTFTWTTAAKRKKVLGITTVQKARKRQLSYRLNIGILNSSFRNGFVYADQEGLLNSDDIFVDHQFKVFSSFRASSALSYTIHRPNKNALQFSYLWDAYKTGGSLDKFEMAHHTLRFSLLFNLN